MVCVLRQRSNGFWLGLLVFLAAVLSSNIASADVSLAQHKVVLQSSSSDPELQGLALTIAGNLQKHYGMDNVDIEVVAYGPGLGIMTADSPYAKKVKSLLDHNVKFSACEGTLKFIEAKQGKRPKLVSGVGTVPDGVVRVIELQEKGYTYVYPR
ncbi:MAG: DsrE family protein [Gammaproteobacteria bacterium]|jgi:intracellular sulfur oxidation DsrE/DsrF family protein